MRSFPPGCPFIHRNSPHAQTSAKTDAIGAIHQLPVIALSASEAPRAADALRQRAEKTAANRPIRFRDDSVRDILIRSSIVQIENRKEEPISKCRKRANRLSECDMISLARSFFKARAAVVSSAASLRTTGDASHDASPVSVLPQLRERSRG